MTIVAIAMALVVVLALAIAVFYVVTMFMVGIYELSELNRG